MAFRLGLLYRTIRKNRRDTDVSESAVVRLPLRDRVQVTDEPGVRVRIRECLVSVGDGLFDEWCHCLIDEMFTVPEVVVQGSDTDNRVSGDLVQGNSQPVRREERSGGLQEPLTVLMRVAA